MTIKYHLPDFLEGKVERAKYVRWVRHKANEHFKRDRLRKYGVETRGLYCEAIHEAVVKSQGVDFYTGEALDWHLIGTWDNVESKSGGRGYKANFAMLPSLDHYGDGTQVGDFRICAWRTNDAKSDLSHDAFVSLCRRVVAYHPELISAETPSA